jgi:hypothetical protein
MKLGFTRVEDIRKGHLETKVRPDGKPEGAWKRVG